MSRPKTPMLTAGQTEQARTGRMVALVIAGAMLLWMSAQWIGGQIGLDPAYAYLFDLAAIAALIWSLVVIARMWRRQNRAGK